MTVIAKSVRLLKVLSSDPVEFYDRLSNVFYRYAERPSLPRLEHIALNQCLEELSSHVGVEAKFFLNEAGLAEIQSETADRLEELRPKTNLDILHCADLTMARLCYVVTRCLRPRYVVETGVAFGVSSAFILQALEINGSGELISIDLPPLEGADRSIGSVVPNHLRKRWQLRRGSSRRELPRVTAALSEIGIFIHDSLHTQEHMLWEFATAWHAMAHGSVLIADDIEGNCAFSKWRQRPDILYSASIQEADKEELYQAAAPFRVQPSLGLALKGKRSENAGYQSQ